MLEKDVVKKIREHIEKDYLGRCFKYWGSAYAEKGVADLICVVPPGKACFFEVKLPGKKARPDQLAWLERYRKLGAITGVVTCTQDVDNLLDNRHIT
jgi:hypothetical protein